MEMVFVKHVQNYRHLHFKSESEEVRIQNITWLRCPALMGLKLLLWNQNQQM